MIFRSYVESPEDNTTQQVYVQQWLFLGAPRRNLPETPMCNWNRPGLVPGQVCHLLCLSMVGFLGFPHYHLLPFFFLKDVFFVEGILPQILGRDAPQGVNEVKLEAWDWKNFTSRFATFDNGASLQDAWYWYVLVKFCFMMRSCCRAVKDRLPHSISRLEWRWGEKPQTFCCCKMYPLVN